MKPLIIFDSGVGGFSVFSAVRRRYPSLPILYVADQAYFPYGAREPAWLLSRLTRFTAWFAAQDPSGVVLACNTATTNAIAPVRAGLSVPVFGVEPVIKPLAIYARAAVLTTPATAASLRTRELARSHGPHIRVLGMEGLAQAIENTDNTLVETSIHKLKQIVQKDSLQALGLSCTHYPLILARLRLAMPDVTFFDPSDAVAQVVGQKLFTSAAEDTPAPVRFFTTGKVLRLKAQAAHYLGIIPAASHLAI